MKTATEHTEFNFKGLCPYCEGDITAICEGWEEDENGNWKADSITTNCSTEPDIDSDEWEEHFNNHSDLPYVHILPMHQRILKHINERYIFDLS